MSNYQLQTRNLITTKVHSMDQNVFIVTEERITSLNNHSSEFQIYLALFSMDLGYFLSRANEPKSIGFIVSSILGVVFFIFLSIHYKKFNRTRKDIFVKK